MDSDISSEEDTPQVEICPVCLIVLPFTSLDEHMKRTDCGRQRDKNNIPINPESCVKCSVCDGEFTDFKCAKEHTCGHSLSDNSCGFCDRTFDTTTKLQVHLKITHPPLIIEPAKPKIKRLKCATCGKTFKSKSQLEGHFNSSECGQNLKPTKPSEVAHGKFESCGFKCIVCGEMLQINKLKSHMQSHNQKSVEKTEDQKSNSLDGPGESHLSLENAKTSLETSVNKFQCEENSLAGNTTSESETRELCDSNDADDRSTAEQKVYSETGPRENIDSSGSRTFRGYFRNYRCTLCGKLFMPKQLHSHIKLRHGEHYNANVSHMFVELTNDPLNKPKMGEPRTENCESDVIIIDDFDDLNSDKMEKTPKICSLCGNSFASKGCLGAHVKSCKNHANTSSDRNKKTGKKRNRQEMVIYSPTEKTDDENETPKKSVKKHFRLCPVCGKRFQIRELSGHFRLKHPWLVDDIEKSSNSVAAEPSTSKVVDEKKQHGGSKAGPECYKCNICSKMFSRIWNFIKHKWTHYPEKCLNKRSLRYKNKFKSTCRGDKMRHKQMLASGKRTHKCNMCLRNFKSLSEFNRHNDRCKIVTVESEQFESPSKVSPAFFDPQDDQPHRIFKCLLCGTIFSETDLLVEHLKAHGMVEEIQSPELRPPRIEMCSTCGISCDTEQMAEHQRTECDKNCANDKTSSVQCTVCNDPVSLADLEAHLKSHVKNEDSRDSEHVSLEIKSEDSELTDASDEEIDNAEQSHVCPICQGSFETALEREDHMKDSTCGESYLEQLRRVGVETIASNDDMEPEKYRCTVCGMTYSCHNQCRKHVMTAHGTRNHRCGECGKRFAEESSLDNHLRRKHASPCPVCGMLFSAEQMKDHLMTDSDGQRTCKTGYVMISDNSPGATGCKYQCATCGKIYANTSNCKRHMEKHADNIYR